MMHILDSYISEYQSFKTFLETKHLLFVFEKVADFRQ